jgi:hypothetical protein
MSIFKCILYYSKTDHKRNKFIKKFIIFYDFLTVIVNRIQKKMPSKKAMAFYLTQTYVSLTKNYVTLISFAGVFFTSFFGIVILKTPSLCEAFILSASAVSGKVKQRENEL